MALGPGKYDDACTAAREGTRAQCVLLVVLDGALGSGFSVQTLHPSYTAGLPQMLREMALQIEQCGDLA